ncbi:hypothetical protein H4F05_00400 [Vibrio cholerae]
MANKNTTNKHKVISRALAVASVFENHPCDEKLTEELRKAAKKFKRIKSTNTGRRLSKEEFIKLGSQ